MENLRTGAIAGCVKSVKNIRGHVGGKASNSLLLSSLPDGLISIWIGERNKMKPREKKPETVFRIIDRATGEAQGSYSRAACDEYDFASVEEARSANLFDVYKDRQKFAVAKYRVIYELIDDDCD